MSTKTHPSFFIDTRNKPETGVFLCVPEGRAYVANLDTASYDILPMSKKGMAEFAATRQLHPSKQLIVIGVTGTNGKTSTVQYISQSLESLGASVLCIGTLTDVLTTPDAWELQERFATHLKEGGTHVVMEVSSHGIDQYRVFGIDFDVTLLTNISQDHLDYHKSFEAYKAIKLGFLACAKHRYFLPEDYDNLPIAQHCPTAFHKKNLQAAKAVLLGLGYELATVDESFQHIKHPPGRFEFVQKAPFSVIVDYAHSPDGLQVALEEAKRLLSKTSGQLLCVFGCGGDRDKDKRPKMGQIAEHFSDRVVLTSDNPRSEAMQAIADDIVAGMRNQEGVHIELDRKKAITYSIQQAKPGDLVLIAGKGHETEQLIGNKRLPFDDRVIAKQVLSAYA